MHTAEYNALTKELTKLEKDLEHQETNGTHRACIILRAAIVAGGSLLSRIEDIERIDDELLRAGPGGIDDGIRRLSVDDRVDSPLSLEERKLALEERRLEVEVRDRAIARFDNAKAAAIARLDNAKAAYKAELDRYVDYLSTADSARDARPTDSGNVFGQLRVYTDNISASNHECKVATYRHLFFRSKDLLPLAAKFQAICLRNARVVACQIDDQAPVADRTEEAFAKQVVRDMAPRLRVILAEVVGLANIHIQTLHKNSGVDIGLTAYSSDYGRTEFFLPIEVKNVFGADTNTNRVPERNADNYRANEDELRAICCQEQQLNPEALWHAFSQIAHYMEHDMLQTNYGVVVAKNAIFLLWRTDSNRIMVSDGIRYTSTDPHPAAIIAFFVAFMLRHSTAVNIPGLNPELHLLGRASRRQDSANTSPTGGGDQNEQHQQQQQRIRRSAAGGRMGIIPVGRGGIESQPYANRRISGNRPADDAVESTDGFSTACESADEGKYRNDTADQLGFMKRPLDLGFMKLRHFQTWRCAVFYGTWHSGQLVAVKAASTSNSEMMAEITNELAVYHRLKGLQGVDIPRLFEHGYGYVDGEEYAVLIMERICEPALMVESMMFDERPVFKELTTLEKTACVNALGRIHRHGVSHNDVRGANLLFRTAPDGQRTPVFIDFGFAEWASKVNSFARCCKYDYVSLMNIFETNGNV